MLLVPFLSAPRLARCSHSSLGLRSPKYLDLWHLKEHLRAVAAALRPPRRPDPEALPDSFGPQGSPPSPAGPAAPPGWSGCPHHAPPPPPLPAACPGSGC